jgi:hypothetical protein
VGCDGALRKLERMKTEHKLLFLGALVGGVACTVAGVRALRRPRLNAIEQVRGRASIDDTPSPEPSKAPRTGSDVERLDESIAPAAPF